MVDQPLPDYLLHEIPALLENQAAGDETLMVARDHAPAGVPDFWLFDADTPTAAAMAMYYDSEGRFEDFRRVHDLRRLHVLEEVRRSLLQVATPLNVWLASRECA